MKNNYQLKIDVGTNSIARNPFQFTISEYGTSTEYADLPYDGSYRVGVGIIDDKVSCIFSNDLNFGVSFEGGTRSGDEVISKLLKARVKMRFVNTIAFYLASCRIIDRSDWI